MLCKYLKGGVKMQEELLKDAYGKMIGRVIIESNGDKTLKNNYGNILGFYRKQRNITTDRYGKIIAYGDCLMMLLR